MAKDARANITMTRNTFENMALGQLALSDAIESGDVKTEGDAASLSELLSYVDSFEFWFNIVEPL